LTLSMCNMSNLTLCIYNMSNLTLCMCNMHRVNPNPLAYQSQVGNLTSFTCSLPCVQVCPVVRGEDHEGGSRLP